jgi:dolichol-phosphate mannosyltransferase
VTVNVAAAASELIELPEPWSSSRITVVLPTYNEAENIPVLLGRLFELPLPGLRVVVVDDDSPDGTGEIADKLSGKYGVDRLSVVHRQKKEGLGRAYVEGMGYALSAGAEYVVQMDSDLSHDPEYITQMLGVLLSTDASVVIGSRYVVGASLATEWQWYRKALSAWANLYVHVLLGVRVRDVTSGFKVWRRSALEAINLPDIHSNGYSFQVEMNYRSLKKKLKIVEVPIRFAERSTGTSKMNFRVQVESALMPFKLRRARVL